ncbi:MAG: ChbG/HpnK family deacetylase [Desulfuromonadales bacterium]|nr:ChbG/HpnK family deacetylase [Desulfuromonadales bacterium]
MRRLIVNADDLGSGSERDRGIIQSFSDGIVSSASLLANGPSFASAAAAARQIDLPLGVHLNLSEGVPLCGPIAGLTTDGGEFPGKTGLRRYLVGKEVDPAPLYRELAAQIEKVLTAGLIPDHLDTHQHFSLFPVATTLLIDLARKYTIPALRLPVPVEPALDDPAGELGADLALYRRLAPAFAAQIRGSGLATPDGLLGMPLLNWLNQETLLATLRSLPEGTWELMVHPGYPDNTSPFSGAARHTELLALTASVSAVTLQRCGITPISFRELTCGF